MTAISAIRRSDGIYLLTDGAVYNSEGVILKIAPKVLMFPQCPAALAVRGSELVAQNLLSLQVEGFANFDELLEYLPIGLRVATELAQPIAQFGLGGGRAEVVACGWSKERGRPEIWVVSNRDTKVIGQDGGLTDIAAFEATESLTPYLGVEPPKELAEEFGFGLPENPDEFDPFRHGVAWMHCLRRMDGDEEHFPHEAQTLASLSTVGGFVQMTTLYQSGLDSRIVLRWPDKVGQAISKR